MFIIQIVILVIEIGLALIAIFLTQFIKRFANTVTEKQLAYESEKGKNLATKEDIEEITKQIETVKTEISFESQRKKEIIEERKKHLIDILFNVQKIIYGSNRLLIYGHNFNEPKKLYELNEEMNAALLDLTHDGQVVISEFVNLDGIETLTNLIDDTSRLVAEITTKSHNVANLISGTSLFKSNVEQGYTRDNLSTVNSILKQATELVDTPIENKKKVEQDVEDYMVWLNKLFGKGLNFKYNLS